MKSDQRLLLKATQLLILFLSAIAAHSIAGGSFLGSSQLAVQSSVILAIVALTFNLKLEGPSLALVILLVQSSSHIILGGNSNTGEFQMTASHLISGVISYRAIRYFELAWNKFAEILISFFAAFKSVILDFCVSFTQQQSQFLEHLQLRFLTSFLKFRGPPSDWSYR
jgi:hypothetical protein